MILKKRKTIPNELLSDVKDTLKKSTKYATIAAVAAGSSVVATNTANAAAVTLANNSTSTVTQINEATDTVTVADSATAAIITLNTGDITMASLGNTGAGNAVITITDTNTGGALGVTGDVTVSGGNLSLTFSDDTTTLTLAGNVTESNSKVAIVNLNSNDITVFSGTGSNVDAKVDGVADGEGTINVTGTVTFDDSFGSVKEIATLNVSGASTFNAALDVQAVTVTADTTLAAAQKSDTIAVTDAVLTVQNAMTDTDDGSETLVLTLNDTSSTGQVTYASGSAVSHTGTIVAAADGEGKILVAEGAGAAGNETTFTSTIGVTATRIGEIAVGTSTLSGLADFEGVVFTDALSVVGGDHADEDSQIDIGANVTATNGTTLTPGTGDAKLLVTANATLAGTINQSGTGTGSSILAVTGGTATISGIVGGTLALDSFTMADTTAAAINADFGVTTTTITDAGAITYGGSADQTHTGAIVLAADDDGTIQNSNTSGELTITGAIGSATKAITEITLDDGAKTNFNSAIFALTLDMDTNGETTVFAVGGNEIGDTGGNAGALQIVAGAVIELGTAIGDGTTVFDTTTVSANAAGVVIAGDITVIPAANFTSGTIVLIQGDAANITTGEKADILVQDTALVDYTVDDGGGTATHDIGITATAKTASAAGTALNITSNDATGLLQALNSANTASDSTVVTALNNALQQINGSTTATATAAAKQLAPQQDLIVGSSAALKANTGSLQSVMSNRMASLRSGDAYVAGMSAGDGVSANSMFMQAYGSIVQQDDKIVGSGHQSGYDADTAGVAFGVDGITDGGLVMGLSVSMANTDLEGKGTGNAKNDIDSYAASIYMDKTGDAGYVEGSVTFGISENASSRVVNTLGIDRTYKGDYDTQQVSVKIGGGLPYEAQNGAYVTPFASLTGTLIESDAYTETSSANNDALRIRYDQDDINSIVGTIGLKAHYDTGNGVPMISLSVNNEFGDTDVVTTNTYQGGGTAFKTTTAIEEMSATLGLGYTFTNGNTDVNVGVEAEANNDDYFGGYGNVKVTSRF